MFDKAAWHRRSVEEHGLPEHQTYVHGGLFFGWAVRRGLTARWIEERTPDAFAAFRAGRMTGPQLLAVWDGAILDDMFGDEGLAFVVDYFDLRGGAYLGDYLRTLAEGLPSEFHVEDNAENARRLDEVLDRRFAEWRQTWDPAQGRPDVRLGLEEVDAGPLPSTLELPVLPVSSGVPLPHGPLGVRAGRPGSIGAVERALAGDRRLLLVPLARPGRLADPKPDDLLGTGVVAEVRTARRVPESRGAWDVSLACLARAEVESWSDVGARVRVLEEPEPADEDERTLLEEARLLAADVVTRRGERHEPPGMLALAVSTRGAPLLDVIARDLPMTREERLTVLEAPDLRTRAEVVLDALRREP